jgi:putative transposase
MCRVLGVSRSGYYGWQADAKSKQKLANAALLKKIENAYEKSHKTYGSRRIHQDLICQGERCSRNRVARLMNQYGIMAKTKRKFRATTNSKHNFPVAQNLLDRHFEVGTLNKVWVADITYIPTDEGWLYLAAVMDLASKKIVGLSMGEHVTKELAMDALKMAIHQRKPSGGLMHHSDRGVQYASNDYQDVLRNHKMVCSMSRKGDCWDNAAMESFFGSLKTECTYHRCYHSRSEARRDILYYIEVFYNNQRLHSTLCYRSPLQFEQQMAA